MPATEKDILVYLDEAIDETLTLNKRDRARFTDALMERFREENVFEEDDEDLNETPDDDEEDV